MRSRVLALTLALSALFGLESEARAHRLQAACQFLPGRMVRVETWFDNGETPRAGDVEVTGTNSETLVKGRLSSQGLFLFDAPEGQPLQVVVEAGEGHRAEVVIKPEEVVVAQGTENSATALPSHEESFPLKDVLLGIGLLLAVAAFVLSLRNARALRTLRRSQRDTLG
jgi:nickel transport protein